MSDIKITAKQPQKSDVSIRSYLAGFILSVILTLAAFGVVGYQLLGGWQLVATLVTLALFQLIVQLIFFLHIGREKSPRWNLLLFVFMVIVVAIIVAGSIWIMNNLNYNMTPEEMDTYMLEQNARGF